MKNHFSKFNKKSSSEIISFLLISIVMIAISSSVYFYSQQSIEKTILNANYEKAQIDIKHLKKVINEISRFNSTTTSFSLDLSSSTFLFNKSQIVFHSGIILPKVSNREYCFENYCENILNNEKIIIQKFDNIEFDKTTILENSKFLIIFTYLKESPKGKIILKIK